MKAALLALALLAGCAMFTQPGTVPVSEKLSPAAQSAQTAINEANILLTAAANVIAQNVVDGISTKDEGQKQIDQVRTYATQVDRAQKLLESGDIVSARNQAELAQKLIATLHREVAARARKP
jgi:hypothetical protein